MKKIPFNLGWKRSVGERVEFWRQNPNAKEEVNLPDDFIINMSRNKDAIGGAHTGYFPGGRAVYSKEFDVPEEWCKSSVLLDIDGAYMNTEVTLNGENLGVHPYGYTPWLVNLDNAIIPGEKNELEIVTRCVQPNSRWYSGGGIYREVNLWVGEACHIKPWDLFVTTPDVSDKSALIKAEATLTNVSDDVANGTFSIEIGGNVTSAPVSVPGKGTLNIELSVRLENPALWSAEEPNLYKLSATLETNLGTDTMDVSVGIRQIEIDAEKGMRVNGRAVKLLGGCIHHDNTLLGAAAFPRAEERKVELLKDAGYNAIRFAHNPPSRAMLEACDRIGMYVMDETFDCWKIGKNDLDYHLYFEDWWQKDTAAMVLRDRNHPSVFCWSIGNELAELGGISDGAKSVKMQSDYIRTLDPTRPITCAVHSMIRSKREKGLPSKVPFKREQQQEGRGQDPAERMRQMMSDPNAMDMVMSKIVTNNMGDGFIDGVDVWAELSETTVNPLDIVGYNYFYKRYKKDKEKYPDRIIIATETHAETTYEYYKAMMENEHVIGDFIWTAYDNLGEAGAGRVMHGLQDIMTGMLGSWPWLSCFQGDLDLDGNRRPQSYYRKIMWGKDKGVHLFVKAPEYTGKKAYGLGWQWDDVWENWTWSEEYAGKDIDVVAYADCDEVEFLLNGNSMGKVAVNALKACFTLPYHKGEIKALAWKDGKVIAEDEIVTAGKAARLELLPDRTSIHRDGMDLSFINIKLTDDMGTTVFTSDITVEVEVEGGSLAGLGSGNPCTDENYGTGRRKLWNGLALACVRANTDSSKIVIKVKAKDLEEATVEIECI